MKPNGVNLVGSSVCHEWFIKFKKSVFEFKTNHTTVNDKNLKLMTCKLFLMTPTQRWNWQKKNKKNKINSCKTFAKRLKILNIGSISIDRVKCCMVSHCVHYTSCQILKKSFCESLSLKMKSRLVTIIQCVENPDCINSRI